MGKKSWLTSSAWARCISPPRDSANTAVGLNFKVKLLSFFFFNADLFDLAYFAANKYLQTFAARISRALMRAGARRPRHRCSGVNR
jgi:hypothetical protein